MGKKTKEPAAPKGPRQDTTRVAAAMRISHEAAPEEASQLVALIDDEARIDNVAAAIRREEERHRTTMATLRTRREFADEIEPLGALYHAMIRSACLARVPVKAPKDELDPICSECGARSATTRPRDPDGDKLCDSCIDKLIDAQEDGEVCEGCEAPRATAKFREDADDGIGATICDECAANEREERRPPNDAATAAAEAGSAAP